MWISQDAIDAWTPPQTGTCGAQPVYADVAIETARLLCLLCRLPLRQTEGFLHAIWTLVDVTLPCPDHTTLSRRHATVALRHQNDRAPAGAISLIVDSSGLQVCGQGAWPSQHHGEKQHRRWKQRPIGVDAQGWIVAATLTASHAHDPSHVPELLSQVAHRVDRFIGDGLFDQVPVSTAVEPHSLGARVSIPPRKDAGLSPTATTAPPQREQHVLAIESAGRCGWKRTAGSYAQAYAEHVFARVKRTWGDRLRAKREASQEREVALACQVLNRLRELGRPQA